ncbi:MAG: hypothetical protein ACE5JL_05535 [Dehalococcoidia bacterium]
MVVVIFLGGVLALLCLFLSTRGIFSHRHLAVQETLVSSPGKSLAAGTVAALVVFGIFIGLQLTEVPPLAVVSVTIMAAGLVVILFGLSTVASVLGERVLGLRNHESSPFAQTVVGTFILAAMGAIPVLGWFLIAPVAALLGLGAVVISTMRRGVSGPTAV